MLYSRTSLALVASLALFGLVAGNGCSADYQSEFGRDFETEGCGVPNGKLSSCAFVLYPTSVTSAPFAVPSAEQHIVQQPMSPTVSRTISFARSAYVAHTLPNAQLV